VGTPQRLGDKTLYELSKLHKLVSKLIKYLKVIPGHIPKDQGPQNTHTQTYTHRGLKDLRKQSA